MCYTTSAPQPPQLPQEVSLLGLSAVSHGRLQRCWYQQGCHVHLPDHHPGLSRPVKRFRIRGKRQAGKRERDASPVLPAAAGMQQALDGFLALEGVLALESRFSLIEGLDRQVLARSLFSGTGEQASRRVDVPGKDNQQQAAAAKENSFYLFLRQVTGWGVLRRQDGTPGHRHWLPRWRTMRSRSASSRRRLSRRRSRKRREVEEEVKEAKPRALFFPSASSSSVGKRKKKRKKRKLPRGGPRLQRAYAVVTGLHCSTSSGSPGACVQLVLQAFAAALEATPIFVCVFADSWNFFAGGVMSDRRPEEQFIQGLRMPVAFVPASPVIQYVPRCSVIGGVSEFVSAV